MDGVKQKKDNMSLWTDTECEEHEWPSFCMFENLATHSRIFIRHIIIIILTFPSHALQIVHVSFCDCLSVISNHRLINYDKNKKEKLRQKPAYGRGTVPLSA